MTSERSLSIILVTPLKLQAAKVDLLSHDSSRDGPSHGSEGRIIIETHRLAGRDHPQLFPERTQIRCDWLRTPFIVKVCQNRNAGCLITRGQQVGELRFGLDISVLFQNCSHAVCEPLLIVGATPDLDVGVKTKHGSSPIGAPPRWRVIQTAITAFG